MTTPEQNRIILFLVLVGVFILIAVVVTGKRKRRHPTDEYIRTDAKNKAVDFAPSAIITTDFGGFIIQWNKGAEKKLGWTENEAIGKNIVMIIPERYKADHIKGMERVKAGGQSNIIGKSVELFALDKFGEEVPVELRVAKYTSGVNTYLIAALINRTEKLMFQNRINEFNEVERLSRTGYFKWNVLKDIVTASEGFKRIYGIENDGQSSDYYMKRIHADDEEMVRDFLGKANEAKQSYSFTHRIVTSNMTIINIKVNGHYYLRSDGAIDYVLGVIQQI